MAGHKLSLAAQLKGVKAALESAKTPKQFRAGLKRRKEQLQEKLSKS
jgi:hypothetical protein